MQYKKDKGSILFSEKGNWVYSFDSTNYKPELIERMWGDWPDEIQYHEIKTLTFNIVPDDEKKIKEFPTFLNKLSNLISLEIPIDMFNIVAKHIPRQLQSLRLFSPVISYDNLSWPENLMLEKLVYIAIPELTSVYKIYPDQLPNLLWIDYDLQADKKGIILNELPSFPKLQHLIFSHAKDLDVFSPFESSDISSLELFACIGRRFPIENLPKLNKLTYLGINNIAVELDCKLLLNLPNLDELDLMNIKKVMNIQYLLDHPSLKKLFVLDCKNPFKGVGKEAFRKSKFVSLDIDYA